MLTSIKKQVARLFNGADNIVPQELVPFGLMVGASLKFDTNVPRIYKSKCTLPTSYIVSTVGKSTIAKSKMFRFYLGEYHFLQVITNAENEIEECRLWHITDIKYPSTMLEWAKWLADGEGKIGQYNFILDEQEYIRMESWADGDLDWAPPVTFIEKLSNKNNTSDSTIIHQAMSYGRWIREDLQVAEYVMISSISDQGSEYINVMVGIDINPVDVKAFYK